LFLHRRVSDGHRRTGTGQPEQPEQPWRGHPADRGTLASDTGRGCGGLGADRARSVVWRGDRIRRRATSCRDQAHRRHHVMDQRQAPFGCRGTTWA